jgi:hypothetical protein
MWWIWISMAAQAGALQLRTELPRPVAGHAIFDLRLGMNGILQADEQVRPDLCAEVSPMRRISVEACGNGSGVLHQNDGPDMAHFRLRGAPIVFGDGAMDGRVLVGAGFTEVQRASDQPGFRFGEANETAVEAAGPEVSVGLKGRFWVTPHSHIAVDVVAGSAYIPGAPSVMGWESPVVPFVSLSTGMGF